MNAYVPDAWGDFFVAEIGASAALLGLLIVAISINLDEILKYKYLPHRSAETIGLMAIALFVVSVCLAPVEDNKQLAVLILIIALLGELAIITSQFRTWRRQETKEEQTHASIQVLMAQCSLLPWVIGGVTLWLGAGGGLYWILLGILTTFAAVLMNCWVLLVEIRR